MGKKSFNLSIDVIAAAQFCLGQVFSQGGTPRMQVVGRQYRLLCLDRFKYDGGGKVYDDVRPVHEVDGVDVAGYAYVGQAPQGGVPGQGLLPAAAGVRLDDQFHAREAGNDAYDFAHFFPEGGEVALPQEHDDFEPAAGAGQRRGRHECGQFGEPFVAVARRAQDGKLLVVHEGAKAHGAEFVRYDDFIEYPRIGKGGVGFQAQFTAPDQLAGMRAVSMRQRYGAQSHGAGRR